MTSSLKPFANVFRIPDLRKRVLFTLGCWRSTGLGGHIPTPGIDAAALGGVLRSRTRARIFGFFDLFAGGNIPPADDLRAGHHALHHGVDHPAVADGGGADARKAAEGRRAGPAQDHPVDPLPDRRSWR